MRRGQQKIQRQRKKRCNKKVTKKRRIVYRILKIDDKGIMRNFKSSRGGDQISENGGQKREFRVFKGIK